MKTQEATSCSRRAQICPHGEAYKPTYFHLRTSLLASVPFSRMKLVSLVLFASALFGGTSAHYIFTNLNGNSAVVRQPGNNSPVEDVNSPNMRCNTPPNPASSVLTVAAGSTVSLMRYIPVIGPYTLTSCIADIWSGQRVLSPGAGRSLPCTCTRRYCFL